TAATAGRRPDRAVRQGCLGHPVAHVHDVPTELLMKLALLDRAGRSLDELLDRQLAAFAPLLFGISANGGDGGLDTVITRWRREQARVAIEFVNSLRPTGSPLGGRT